MSIDDYTPAHFTQKQIEDIIDLLVELDENTKVYFGCDSIRYKTSIGRSMAKFATVCVIHMNGKNGCKIFRHISHEPDFDLKPGRPANRLMKEIQKVCELYTQLAPFLDESQVEIHVDVNTDPIYGSSCVAAQAAGYVFGVTGVEPKLKPDAFAASFAGDHCAHSASRH